MPGGTKSWERLYQRLQRRYYTLGTLVPGPAKTVLICGYICTRDCNMIAEEHENVTILFSDIVSFTTIAGTPHTLDLDPRP